MEDNINITNDIDSGNNDIDKYFDLDNDKLLNSNEEENVFGNTYNLSYSKNEEKNQKNKSTNEITNKKSNSKINNNLEPKDYTLYYNISENESDMIPIVELTDNPNTEKCIKIDNKGKSKNNSVNYKVNDNNNNKSKSHNRNIENKTNIINNKYIINKNKIIEDDDIDGISFPKITNKSEMNIDNINYYKNNINKKKLIEEKIVDNLSLSSSSDDNDVQIVSGEDFRRHFQEEKYGPQITIQVIDNERKPKISPFKYNDKLLPKKNNNKKDDKCFEDFFMDDKDKNKNNEKEAKRFTFYSPQKESKNRNSPKRKKFSPLPRDKYTDNDNDNKLLINKVEKEILTDIYNEYQNKKDFEETYYYLDKIKDIINQKGVDDAMKYMEKIEPLNLRKKIIYEATFFIKEIIRKEVEFAEKNGGKLHLIKQPEYVFEQSLKYNVPLSGKANQNHERNKRGKSSNIYIERKNDFHHNINMVNKNKYDNEKLKYKDLNKKPYLYKSPKRRNNYK